MCKVSAVFGLPDLRLRISHFETSWREGEGLSENAGLRACFRAVRSRTRVLLDQFEASGREVRSEIEFYVLMVRGVIVKIPIDAFFGALSCEPCGLISIFLFARGEA